MILLMTCDLLREKEVQKEYRETETKGLVILIIVGEGRVREI